MPLRCIDPESGRSLIAFDLSTGAWQALESENRSRRHLRMPCCSAKVTLRHSTLGTPFFAHKAGEACTRPPETEAHLHLKQMAIEAARAHGWNAQTEASGQTPSGERWHTDVLAHKGESRVAIEIQWSSLTEAEILHRQERYRLSGVRALWLFRQFCFPIREVLPAALVRGSLRDGYTAWLPVPGRPQEMPMAAFLDAVFGRRFRFSLPPGLPMSASVRAGHLFCCDCGAQTEILTGVDLQAGPHRRSLTIRELGRRGEAWEEVRARLPATFPTETIQPRTIGAQGHRSLSNGCAHCGALMDEVHERQAWADQRVICTFLMPIGEAWCELFRRRGEPESWGVF